MKEIKKVYRSRVDWWVWFVLLASLSVVFAACVGAGVWAAAIIGGGMTAMFAVLMLGCWYEIDGDVLVVYQFFRGHRMPIGKIRSVRKTTGYLATAGMSSRRVSIRFVDRSVLRSSMPVEISPADRDGFIARLREVNPAIEVLP